MEVRKRERKKKRNGEKMRCRKDGNKHMTERQANVKKGRREERRERKEGRTRNRMKKSRESEKGREKRK